jgi:metallophosphoesterase superfamily enzyme
MRTAYLPNNEVATMMVRTQISLPADDHRRAKRRAAELGISLAEYVRRTLARDLGAPAERADVTALVDLGDSGGSDVAAAKDEYVAEAIAARRDATR